MSAFNILTISENEVSFDGFDKLTDSKITIKVFGNLLSITPGELSYLGNRFVFDITNKKSSNPALINFLRQYCHSEKTAFIEHEGAYLQTNAIKI